MKKKIILNLKFKIAFLIFVNIILINEVKGFGLADWQFTTYHGNILYHPGGATYLQMKRGDSKELDGLQKWYFCNKRIVGTFKHRDSNGKEFKHYFIAHEVTGKINTFSKIEDWKNEINQQNLDPLFWINWHFDHYSNITFLLIMCMFFFPIPLCFTIWLFYTFYKIWKKREFDKKSWNNRIFIGFITLIFLSWLEDLFIWSI